MTQSDDRPQRGLPAQLSRSFRTIEPPSAVDPQLLAQHVQSRLDLGHRELARLRCLLVAACFLTLALIDYLVMPATLNIPTMTLALFVVGTFLALAGIHHFVRYPARLANHWMLLEVALLQADGLAFLALTADVMSSLGVYVLTIAAGIFMTRLNWLIAAVAMLLISWLTVVWWYGVQIGPREALMITASLLACAFFFTSRRRVATNLGEHELREASYSRALEHALTEIETLSGLLPICASCKSIRDEDGAWHQLERFVSQRSNVEFTHSLCPPCAAALDPRAAAAQAG